MVKLQWHFSKFGFYNGISPNHESCSGMNPINPSKIDNEMMTGSHQDL
jgi:hypothetical protein